MVARGLRGQLASHVASPPVQVAKHTPASSGESLAQARPRRAPCRRRGSRERARRLLGAAASSARARLGQLAPAWVLARPVVGLQHLARRVARATAAEVAAPAEGFSGQAADPGVAAAPVQPVIQQQIPLDQGWDAQAVPAGAVGQGWDQQAPAQGGWDQSQGW